MEDNYSEIKKIQDKRIAVFISGGRDSIVMLDLLKKNINRENMTFIFLWCYPKGICAYKDNFILELQEFFDIKINYEISDSAFMVNNRIPKITFSKRRDQILKKYNCQYASYGWVKGESMNRNIIMKHTNKGVPFPFYNKHGICQDPQNHIYPLWFMNKNDVINHITENKLPETPEYSYIFRDITIFREIASKWLADVYPDDFERVCRYDPQSMIDYQRIVLSK